MLDLSELDDLNKNLITKLSDNILVSGYWREVLILMYYSRADLKSEVADCSSQILSFESSLVSATRTQHGDLPHLKISPVTRDRGETQIAFETGRAQGVLLAEEIRQVWKFYRERFKPFTDEQLENKAGYYQKVIADFDPSYSCEIGRIAIGAICPRGSFLL